MTAIEEKTGTASAGRLEEDQVISMFDRIASVYDLMNSVMTAGLHRKWRSRAAEIALNGAGSSPHVLDVATGTGDLAIELAKQAGPASTVIGCDFSEAMLSKAREKSELLSFETANALQLPYEDNEFNCATVGFGARNFDDLSRGISEMARVVKPGGRVVILEITTPKKPPLSWFYRFWFDQVVPTVGRATGQGDAYTYLPNSVKRFPDPEGLAAEMDAAGLKDIRYVLTAGGIIATHYGVVA